MLDSEDLGIILHKRLGTSKSNMYLEKKPLSESVQAPNRVPRVGAAASFTEENHNETIPEPHPIVM